MANPMTWVEAPPRQKRPNTSLDVIPTHDVTNDHFTGFQFVPDPCTFPGLLPRDCYIQYGPTTPAVNEVQRATITGTPTGGTFTLTYAGQTTTAIAYNATAATVQTALEALSNIAPLDVAVTGGPGPGTPYTITFGGTLASQDIAQMTAAHAFTGGAGPAIAITTITGGVSPKTFSGYPTAVSTQVFGVYQGIECWLNGDVDDFRSVAQRVLEAGEYFAVDGVLSAQLATLAVATVTSTNMATALAALEAKLAQSVPAQGYIYMGAAAATHAAAAHLLVRNLDGTLETYLGTPIVILTDPTIAVMYASGPVTIWRGPVNVIDAPNLILNKGRALAERLYSLAIECGAWKVTFTAPAAEGQEPETLTMSLGSNPSSPIPDGTDTTITAQTNIHPPADVFLHYRINSGPDVTAGEMVEVSPLEFVWNVEGSATTSGDSVEVWAETMYGGGIVESNHITIEVT